MTLRLSTSQARKYFAGGKSVSIETRRSAQAPARPRGGFGLDRELRPVVDLVDILLPTPPSSNALFYNREEGGRGKTKQYEDWIAEAGWKLAQQRPGRIAGAYEIELRVFRPADGRRRDLDNIIKPLSDLLVRMKVVSDDSQCQRIVLSWRSDDTGVRVILKPWRVA